MPPRALHLVAVAFAVLIAVRADALPPTLHWRALAPVPIATVDDAGARALTLADVNNDGLADAIVARPDEELVTVSLAQGDGSFGARSTTKWTALRPRSRSPI
jgi:hypothetical protein